VPLKERYLLSSTLDVVNPNKNINILFWKELPWSPIKLCAKLYQMGQNSDFMERKMTGSTDFD
jgi:hypothetical protein